jgi:curli biogenesis system outer membrane secretion channel CsgG
MNRVLVISVLFFANVLADGQQSPVKHRIAVLDFNYAGVLTSSQAVFGSSQNIGKGISDMLADRLTNDGTFRIIERNAINKVLSDPASFHEDHDNSSSHSSHTNAPGWNNPGNFGDIPAAPPAPRVGHVLGVDPVIQYFAVDAIITGEITQFGRNEDRNGSGVLGRLRKLAGNGESQKSKAVVGLTAHMIDVNTGEILVSVNVKAESLHAGNNLLRVGTSTGMATNMMSTNFPKTILGEAVTRAIEQLVQAFEQKSSTLPAVDPTPVSGLVADVSGADVTINVGNQDGVHVGDTLLITRITRVIKDPATGKIIRSVEDTIGQITITSVDFSSAVGRFTGSGKVAVNDTVKNLPKQN